MRQLKTEWRFIVAYLLLFVIGIPWYWPQGDLSLILGIPAWVFIAIVVSIIVSILTTYILLTRQWPGEAGPEQEKHDE